MSFYGNVNTGFKKYRELLSKADLQIFSIRVYDFLSAKLENDSIYININKKHKTLSYSISLNQRFFAEEISKCIETSREKIESLSIRVVCTNQSSYKISITPRYENNTFQYTMRIVISSEILKLPNDIALYYPASKDELLSENYIRYYSFKDVGIECDNVVKNNI